MKDIPNFNKFFLFFKVCSIYFKELLSFLHHLVYLHSLIYQFVLHCCAPFSPRSGGRSPLRPPGHSPFFCRGCFAFFCLRLGFASAVGCFAFFCLGCFAGALPKPRQKNAFGGGQSPPRCGLGFAQTQAKKSGAEQIGAMPPAAEAKPSVLD